MSNVLKTDEPILRVRDFKKHFPVEGGLLKRTVGYVKAVDGINFDVRRGESFGIVGESGCGKSTLGRAILRLLEPTGGSVEMIGEDGDPVRVEHIEKKDLRRFRRRAQMIFQDPRSALNSRMTIGELIKEPLLVHGLLGDDRGNGRLYELMGLVGLPRGMENRFPHEVSGGQRQRIGIARALALDPELIICDEAVSALDVSVQAQVLNLLMDLQERLGLTYLFISHDLSVIRHFCHRVAVLYLGKIVEIAETDRLFDRPEHPYTKALLSAIPEPGVRKRKNQILLEGEIPSPSNPPSGCRFRTRCWAAAEVCAAHEPELEVIDGEETHRSACHFNGEVPPWRPKGSPKDDL